MQQSPASFTFTCLQESDLPLLFTWFQQQYIAQLWKEPADYETFKEKYIAQYINASDLHPFIAYRNEKPIGFIKYHHMNDEDRAVFPNVEFPHLSVGIDLFIGEPAYLNKGYGTRLLKEFTAFTKKREPACKTIMIDPAVDNERAIACYKKVGFKEVGIYTTPYGPTGQGPGPILLMLYQCA